MNRKALMRHARRGMEILLRQGPKAFYNKVKIKMEEGRVVYVAPVDERILAYKDLTALTEGQLDQLVQEDGTPVLAVQLHLYYEDLLPEFIENLKHIPCKFDLYISIRDYGDETTVHMESISTACQQIPHLGTVVVRATENRGRDIAPMYVLFGKELRKYKYVLHMHSKKSLYQGAEQLGWRQYSVKTLIGSIEQAGRMISLMEQDEEIGLIYPERYVDMAPEAYGWLSDEAKGREFLESIGVPFQGGIFLYPAGSFFIVRNAAISQIWNRNLKYTDFDEEEGQTDGTLAHVLERALAQVVSYNGYHHAIVADDRSEIHIDRDKHTFAPVFLRDQKKMVMDLSAYDVISFDIFDTLLTRVFYHPVDVFHYMESVLQGSSKGVEDFAQQRIQAEQSATAMHGASTNLYHIYEELQKELHLSDVDRDAMLELELQVESMALIPRRDMVALYQEVLQSGRDIILTSDMYLTADMLRPILEKCGITGYKKLYLSCEVGKRKDDDTLWQQVLEDCSGRNIAHVGDNMQSDWQKLSDRNEKTSWIMNPRQEEQIAAVASIERAYKAGRGANRGLLHGLMINGGLYNSPFALYPTGAPEFKDAYTLGYTVFGPLMYEYMRWLHEHTLENANLAFLAREGYIFMQVYEAMYGEQTKDHLYLLASRRSISVAAIRSEEDIREICRRDYDGDLRNLLKSRLGAPQDILEQVPEKYVHFKEGMPDDDYERAMKWMEPHFPQIVEYAKVERENYLRYFHRVIPEEAVDRTVYVDIGYAGTIQYYLCKLLEHPVTGAYMAVFKEHAKLQPSGCEVLAMYRKEQDVFAEVLEQTQLFLESVLQAPYGQLLHFDAEAPVYKEEAKPSQGIVELQEGLLDYVKQRAGVVNQIENHSGEDVVIKQRKYMESMYELFLSGAYIGETVASIFTVEDTYSQDSVLHYDGKSHKWRI